VGLCGVLLSFIPDSETGQLQSVELAAGCLGLAVAGLTSALMILFRPKNRPASAWLAMGIMSWFVGVNILGWGVFAALSPGDTGVLENLGFSIALCFAPGGFLALLGLIFYGYDYRRARKIQPQVGSQVVELSEPARSRADKLQRAAEYRTHIEALLKQYKGSALSDQLAPMQTRLSQWETHLRQLVNRLNEFEANQIIQRDLRDVPAAIRQLEQKLDAETNPQVRQQMKETLDSHQEHQHQLDALVSMMQRTELDIDETLAEIGTIYSRLQLLDAKDIDSNRVNRLSEDIEEQAGRLGDLLSAMDEVYDSTARLS
jgi:hypothetical protein